MVISLVRVVATWSRILWLQVRCLIVHPHANRLQLFPLLLLDSAAAGLQRYEDLSAQVPRAAQPQGGLRSVDGQHRYEDLSAQGAQVAQSQGKYFFFLFAICM